MARKSVSINVYWIDADINVQMFKELLHHFCMKNHKMHTSRAQHNQVLEEHQHKAKQLKQCAYSY